MIRTGISIAELEVLISKKLKILHQLELKRDAPKEEVIYNAGNGQVGYYSIGANEGINKEIYQLKQEINELQTELQRMEKAKLEKELNVESELERKRAEKKEREEEEIEQKKHEDLQHKNQFITVREIYKRNTNFLERAILKVQGKGLRAASSYTNEELEYLIATYQGDTQLQQAKLKHLDPIEQSEKINQKNIAAFKNMIGRENIESFIAMEENGQGHTR